MGRIGKALIGLVALALMAGAVAVTGVNLVKGGLTEDSVSAYAKFVRCGQGLRERGDLKLRGVLIGRLGTIERQRNECTVELEIRPGQLEKIPENAGAQIRAKTIFGEKWVEVLFPPDPSDQPLAEGAVIEQDRTIDPLEVETILNLSVPILDAIDPENLSGALDALAEGFIGHEEAAIRGIESGLEALEPINENPKLFSEGLRQMQESGDLLDRIDEDLFQAMRNLDNVQRFTIANQALIAESLRKNPELLRELATLFETRFVDFTKIVNSGATVISVLAARADDLDRLLDILPRFNAAWIRNLNHVCEFRQVSDEGRGRRVPGRCWRVHNVISHTQGGYHGNGPRDERNRRRNANAQPAAPTDIASLLTSALKVDEGR